MKVDKPSLIRTIILIIALFNQTLVSFGKHPLPFENDQIENFITITLTIVAALIAWFKNNYITHKGRTQKAVLKMHEEQVKK